MIASAPAHSSRSYQESAELESKIKLAFLLSLHLSDFSSAQFFTPALGKMWVDIGLGIERMQCPVGKRFRVVIIANSGDFQKFPIPLLNRLEKHTLLSADALDPPDLELCERLQQRLATLLPPRSIPKKDVFILLQENFPGYSKDTVPSLVASLRARSTGDADLLEAAWDDLLWMATPGVVLGSKMGGVKEQYFVQQQHDSLEALVAMCMGVGSAIRAFVTTFDSVSHSERLRKDLTRCLTANGGSMPQVKSLHLFSIL